MLRAGEFVLQLRHLLFSTVQDPSHFGRQPQIGGGALHFRATLQFRAQPLTQLIYIRPNLLKERLGDRLALVQKSGKKMLVRDFWMISLRGQILRALQRLLHLLCVFIDAHASRYERRPQRQCAVTIVVKWHAPIAAHHHAFDTDASTRMTVCDELGSEVDDVTSIACSALWSAS